MYMNLAILGIGIHLALFFLRLKVDPDSQNKLSKFFPMTYPFPAQQTF